MTTTDETSTGGYPRRPVSIGTDAGTASWGVTRVPPPDVRPAVIDIPVFEMPTTYTVSALPEGHIDRPIFEISVEYRDRGRWAVCRMRQCLSVDGQWHFEPSPSNRDADWLASHRFDLDTALSMAREAAPNVRCNGVTAREVAAEIGATP